MNRGLPTIALLVLLGACAPFAGVQPSVTPSLAPVRAAEGEEPPPSAPVAPPAPAARPSSVAGEGAPLLTRPPACLATGECRSVRFRRPEGCSERPSYWRGRKARRCRAERWRSVYVDGAGRVVGVSPPEAPQALGRGRGELELWEILRQWRRCEPDDDPRLRGAPGVLKRHPDPELGVCTLFRPDPAPPADLPGGLGLEGLDELHPYVAVAARELVVRAHRAGVPLRIISKYRPYRPGRKVSWHAWGVGIDVLPTKYRTLREAKRHVKEDRELWRKVGELCRELALWWGGEFRSYDVFHIEWHPGFGGRLAPEQLRRFLALAGRDGRDYRRTWQLFEPGPARSAERGVDPARLAGGTESP